MKIQKAPAPPPRPPRQPDKVAELCFGGAVGAGASLLGSAYPSTYLHELGHALTARALYAGANPSITVEPFKGGVTRWTPSEPTALGRALGEQGSRAAVSAAGTALDVLSSVAIFGAGFKLRHKHPVAGTAMMTCAGMTMLNSTLYAASAIGKSAAQLSRGHDFYNLQRLLGVPAWVSAVVLASVLPLEYLVLKALETRRDSSDF